MHSRRRRYVIVTLLSGLAVGGLTATAAEAEEAPFWNVEGISIVSGETHYIAAKTYNTKGHTGFTLTAAGKKISCSTIKLKEGAILGSSAGNPGTNSEVIELSGGCVVEGNGTGCKVKEPIVSTNMGSELVGSEKGEKGFALMEFYSAKGTSLATIKI